MQQYMSHTDADAFVDWPEPDAKHREIYAGIGYTKTCERCRGYGGWNLRLNAYPLHSYADTAENRHRYSHFRTMCGHCSGAGFVRPDEICTGHDWAFEKNLGRCYNRYRCIHCGQLSDVDSSD